MSWRVSDVAGSPGHIHALDVPDEPESTVWVARPDGAAVVLGSTQSVDTVDADRAEALSLEIVRRRSGGGAVLVVPDEMLWVDVIVPRSDPHWHDDVAVAFHWLGEVWADTLRAFDLEPTVHRGPHEASPLASLVCFAGVGPGEVFLDGRKVVGMSQRRTRGAARFQCALVLTWRPDPLIDVLHESMEPHLVTQVGEAGIGCGMAHDVALARFLEVLDRA